MRSMRPTCAPAPRSSSSAWRGRRSARSASAPEPSAPEDSEKEHEHDGANDRGDEREQRRRRRYVQRLESIASAERADHADDDVPENAVAPPLAEQRGRDETGHEPDEEQQHRIDQGFVHRSILRVTSALRYPSRGWRALERLMARPCGICSK